MADGFLTPTATWDVAYDVHALLQYPYMRHAFVAAACVAVMSGAMGWFMVLRAQTYAGHTLSVVAFPGAAGAALLGWPPIAGFFGACVAGALGIAWLAPLHGENRGQSAAIGSVQAFALALGLLFASLYKGFVTSTTTFLFGSFTGVSRDDVVAIVIITAVSTGLLVVVARPLLFASIDPVVAAARGVPVRLLSVGYLVVLGLAIAGASQFTGALLVFALLAAPPAAARQWTSRPGIAVALSMLLALAVAWAGLGVSYFSSRPAGFLITLFATIVFGLSCGSCLFRERHGRRSR